MGYNIDSDNTCNLTNTGDLPSQTVAQVMLAGLADNGGPTQTHAPESGSVAIDAGATTCYAADGSTPLTTDQRGEPRPLDGDGNTTVECDIGAFELLPYVPVPPDVTGVSLGSQSVQYSDEIIEVTITATDEDSPTNGGADDLTLTTDNPLPASLSVSGTCSDLNDGQTCTWTLSGTVDTPATVATGFVFTATDADGLNSTCSDTTNSCTHTITVLPEEAMVTLSEDNPIDWTVDEPDGDLETLELNFVAVEWGHPAAPLDSASGAAAPGDLLNMVADMELSSVGPGPSPTLVGCTTPPSVSGTLYNQEATFTCTFSNVPVNVYEIKAEVAGGYYTGADEGLVVVSDPSLGFTTGGGFFYWPDTVIAADECLEYDTTECLIPHPCAGYMGDRTNFGFSFKQKKKRNIQGSLLMMRHSMDPFTCATGKYKVKSNVIDGMGLGSANDGDHDYGWAAVTGKATFRDMNGVNSGNNPFMLYVEDHGDQGCNQDPVDQVWIEVLAGNVWLDPLDPEPALDDGTDGDDVEIVCGNIVVPYESGKSGRGRGKPEK